MSGNDLNAEQKAVPCVEPAPEIGLVVRFNGQQQPVILKVDEPETLNFGSFPIELEVVQVIRKKVRPAKAPPWYYIIKNDQGVVARIRAMTEEDARRIFYQRSDEFTSITSIEPELE